MDFLDKIIRLISLGFIAYAALVFLRQLSGGAKSYNITQSKKTYPETEPSTLPMTWETVPIIGASQINLDGSSRQLNISHWSTEERVWLERDETTNPNVINVITKHGQIGFLPREISTKIKDTDLPYIEVRGYKKSASDKEIINCLIQLRKNEHIQATNSKTETTDHLSKKLASSLPLPIESTFKKEATIQAAQQGKLTSLQLVVILDRARELDLSEKEHKILQAAFDRCTNKTRRKSEDISTAAKLKLAPRRYKQGDLYQSICSTCSGQGDIYNLDEDRFTPCPRCSGLGID